MNAFKLIALLLGLVLSFFCLCYVVGACIGLLLTDILELK